MNKISKSKKPTIFVGVSGGVDSSVSLAILKEKGYNVVGAFIKTWQPDFIECTWRTERRDAMRVCAAVDVPFVTIDAEKDYRDEVGMYMVNEYKNGRTPNPDVMCNKEVKFKAFLNKALELGADYVATGHYAQRVANEDGTFSMLAGVDKKKDQTYFLWTLTQDQLSRTLFPVGDIPKSKVRDLAEKFDLPTAQKKDSQGVCFLGEIDMKDFLKHYIDEKPGNVLDSDGNVIGEHEGALFYTYGERHGFKITKKGTDEKPLYVVGKDTIENTITVSSEMKDRMENSKKITIGQTNWIQEIKEGETYTAIIRYNQEPQKCSIKILDEKSAEVTFENPQDTFSPGQSIVVYDGVECLGGGIII